MAFSKCTSPHQKTEQMIPSSSSSSSLSSFSSSSSSASFSFFVLRIYFVFNFVCSHGAICLYMTAGASELLRGGMGSPGTGTTGGCEPFNMGAVGRQLLLATEQFL